jgi:hypothetical protein
MACKSVKKEPFNLASLPADWVKLTKTDSGLIIYNSCNMGNALLTITNKQNKPGILLHGTQEEYEWEILECSQITNDTVLIQARWKDSQELQDFKFVWEDKTKHLGRWITNYGKHTSNEIFVTAVNQNTVSKFDQPCRECFEEGECELAEKLKYIADHPVESIKKVFERYKYTDPTDSKFDMNAMEIGLANLHTISDTATLDLLVNIWMYYDPTDFPTRKLIDTVFKQNKPASIQAVKKRMEIKRKGENENTAPYSALKDLLFELEKG